MRDYATVTYDHAPQFTVYEQSDGNWTLFDYSSYTFEYFDSDVTMLDAIRAAIYPQLEELLASKWTIRYVLSWPPFPQTHQQSLSDRWQLS